MMVFDKTGTLTEDGLQIFGVRSCIGKIGSESPPEFGMFSDNIRKCSETPFSSQEKYAKVKNMAPVKFLECMICCNEITNLHDQMIGDPVDVIMLQSTSFEINDSPEVL